MNLLFFLNRKCGILKPAKQAAYISLLLLCLTGCVSILVAGAGGGIGYTITNIAYKTVNYPIEEVTTAVSAALKKMDITELETRQSAKGVHITALTAELKIYIDLDWITSKTTRISVDARKNLVLKDKATATAIIEQTDNILEGRTD